MEVGGGCFLGGWRLVSLTTVGQMVPGEVGSLSKNKAFWSMVTVPFLWALSNSMIIAVLPDIQTALRISPGRAGLLTTSLSIPTAILLPVAGVLSDRYGRKTIMVPGVILYGLGGALATRMVPLFHCQWPGSYGFRPDGTWSSAEPISGNSGSIVGSVGYGFSNASTQ